MKQLNIRHHKTAVLPIFKLTSCINNCLHGYGRSCNSLPLKDVSVFMQLLTILVNTLLLYMLRKITGMCYSCNNARLHLKSAHPQFSNTERRTDDLNTTKDKWCTSFQSLLSPRTAHVPGTDALAAGKNKRLGAHLRKFWCETHDKVVYCSTYHCFCSKRTTEATFKCFSLWKCFPYASAHTLKLQLNCQSTIRLYCTILFCNIASLARSNHWIKSSNSQSVDKISILYLAAETSDANLFKFIKKCLKNLVLSCRQWKTHFFFDENDSHTPKKIIPFNPKEPLIFPYINTYDGQFFDFSQFFDEFYRILLHLYTFEVFFGKRDNNLFPDVDENKTIFPDTEGTTTMQDTDLYKPDDSTNHEPISRSKGNSTTRVRNTEILTINLLIIFKTCFRILLLLIKLLQPLITKHTICCFVVSQNLLYNSSNRSTPAEMPKLKTI